MQSGVKIISSHAFEHCAELTSITLPDSVTNIRSAAFFECKKLVFITIGIGIASIDPKVFDGCPKTTINYRGSEEDWAKVSTYNLAGYTIIYNYTGN